MSSEERSRAASEGPFRVASEEPSRVASERVLSGVTSEELSCVAAKSRPRRAVMRGKRSVVPCGKRRAVRVASEELKPSCGKRRAASEETSEVCVGSRVLNSDLVPRKNFAFRDVANFVCSVHREENCTTSTSPVQHTHTVTHAPMHHRLKFSKSTHMHTHTPPDETFSCTRRAFSIGFDHNFHHPPTHTQQIENGTNALSFVQQPKINEKFAVCVSPTSPTHAHPHHTPTTSKSHLLK
jgi:hypothetical protein